MVKRLFANMTVYTRGWMICRYEKEMDKQLFHAEGAAQTLVQQQQREDILNQEQKVGFAGS
jgi:hypothetical protein